MISRGRLVDVWLPAVLDSDPASSTYNTKVRPHWHYEYDATGRMSGASVTKDSVTTNVSYKNDANGFRVERTEGSTTTVYLIDPANPTGYTQKHFEGGTGFNVV